MPYCQQAHIPQLQQILVKHPAQVRNRSAFDFPLQAGQE